MKVKWLQTDTQFVRVPSKFRRINVTGTQNVWAQRNVAKTFHRTMGDSIPVTTLSVEARKNNELNKQTEQSILFILCSNTQKFCGRRYSAERAISCKNQTWNCRVSRTTPVG